MIEPMLRIVRGEDAAELAGIWHRVFGDPEALALSFLKRLPALGGGVCAEEGGKLLGAAYAVTDFTLDKHRAAYIYAVAVLPEARGRGGQTLSARCPQTRGSTPGMSGSSGPAAPCTGGRSAVKAHRGLR